MPSLGFCLLVTLGARRLSTYINSKVLEWDQLSLIITLTCNMHYSWVDDYTSSLTQGLRGIFYAFVFFLVTIMAIKSIRRNMVQKYYSKNRPLCLSGVQAYAAYSSACCWFLFVVCKDWWLVLTHWLHIHSLASQLRFCPCKWSGTPTRT